MSNYRAVQFIAWEVYTGPEYIVTSIDSYGNLKYDAVGYPGIKGSRIRDWRKDALNQCIDIDARVAFTEDAILKARSSEKIDDSENVLKIFMAPEFLYRGSAGAYLHDLINGWVKGAPQSFNLPEYYNEWPGLFRKLKKIVADPIYKDWLFIFGTAVGAHFGWDENKKVTLDDINDPGIICNMSLIQPGGPENKDNCHVARKYHKAGKDFLEFKMKTKMAHIIYRKNTSKHIEDPSLISKYILGELGQEGGPLFSFDNIRTKQGGKIDFGIEICLDHFCGYPEKQGDGTLKNIEKGMLKYFNQCVDIQLVPSCGMCLHEKSISLYEGDGDDPRVHSYAFNCDGLLAPFIVNGTEVYMSGAHAQIWDQSPGRNKIESNNDFQNIDADLIKVRSQVDITVYHKDKPAEIRKVNADELWNISLYPPTPQSPLRAQRGSGYIKIFDSKPLSR